MADTAPLTPRQLLERYCDPAFVPTNFGQFYRTREKAWEPGRLRMIWDATAAYAAHGDFIHGGALSSVLDAAMGWATMTLLEDDETFGTMDLQVQFIRAARVGALAIEGMVLRRSRTAAFCRGEIHDADSTLIGHATATQAIMRAR